MSSSDAGTLDRGARAVIIAAILTISAVGTGLSLMLPLLAIELERMGASATLNGLNTAVAGLANIVVAPLVPPFAARFGQRRLLLLCLAGLIATILAFPLLPSVAAWFVLRFVFGLAIGALFVLSEFWITVSAPEARRGLIMGIYATVLALGFAVGPAVLALTGTAGWLPYLACAGLMALAIPPFALLPGAMPPIGDAPHPRVLPLIRLAPVATLAALMFGALETGSFSQLPLYGLRRGLDDSGAALLVTWQALGNLAFQIPIGWLSDRVDRRKVLLACALAGAAGALALIVLPLPGLAFIAVLVAWGGITGAIYTVGLAHLGSRFAGADVAVANAVFVMLYSTGMILGPPLAGLGMDLAGPSGLPLTLALLLIAYALLVAARIRRPAG